MGFHKYEYGLVPPEVVTQALPSLPPKQLTLTWPVTALNPEAGSVMVTLLVDVQP